MKETGREKRGFDVTIKTRSDSWK